MCRALRSIRHRPAPVPEAFKQSLRDSVQLGLDRRHVAHIELQQTFQRPVGQADRDATVTALRGSPMALPLGTDPDPLLIQLRTIQAATQNARPIPRRGS